MEAALALAREAMAAGEVPVGAVVVRAGEIIGRGRNRREADQSILGHAELLAMQEAAEALGTWRLSDCTLYVTLEPCPMCAGAAVNARVARIVFGAEDEVMGACGTAADVLNLPRAYKPALYRGCMAEESAALLRAFFREKRI